MANPKDIVFPSDETSLLISKILQKYGLNETTDEIIEKIRSNKASSTASAAFLVKKIAIGEINLDEAIEKIKNDLMLPLKKAQQVANELNDTVVPLGKEREILEKGQRKTIEKAVFFEKSPPKKEKIVSYREPIE